MEKAMERVNRIIRHPVWREALAQIEALEEGRVFCRHDLDHFLHVARLAYIENLEQNLGIAKELIYSAALLHDIGRGLPYTEGVGHEAAGCAKAPDILRACGFSAEEVAAVTEAISAHRQPDTAGRRDLAGVLYRADKASRNCFACAAEPLCNWSEEKKNREVKG